MSFQFSRLRRGDRLVAVGCIALVIFMFFFKWFDIKVPGIIGAYLRVANVSTSINAWHSLEYIRWLLLLTVISGFVLVALVGSDRKLSAALSTSAIVAGLGVLSAVLVFYRAIISHPFTHIEVKLGTWLGFIACVTIAYGGLRAMSEDDPMPAPAGPVESSP